VGGSPGQPDGARRHNVRTGEIGNRRDVWLADPQVPGSSPGRGAIQFEGSPRAAPFRFRPYSQRIPGSTPSVPVARTLVPSIDAARCTGCGRCVAACSPHVLSLEPRGWVKSSALHDAVRCTGCGECEMSCPFGVIAMVEAATCVEPEILALEDS
jgi:ferredoxin